MTKGATSIMKTMSPAACKGKNGSKLFVIAIYVVTVAMVHSSPAPYVDNAVNNGVLERQRVLFYETEDGVQHYERMIAEGDILTVQSADDGFIAIFDQGRSIVVFKNTTSGVCFFTRLENFPEMNIGYVDELPPVYFQEADQISEVSIDPGVVVLTYDRSAVIPSEYIAVSSSEIVTGQCVDGAYWVNPRDGKMVKRGWLATAIITAVIMDAIHD